MGARKWKLNSMHLPGQHEIHESEKWFAVSTLYTMVKVARECWIGGDKTSFSLLKANPEHCGANGGQRAEVEVRSQAKTLNRRFKVMAWARMVTTKTRNSGRMRKGSGVIKRTQR